MLGNGSALVAATASNWLSTEASKWKLVAMGSRDFPRNNGQVGNNGYQ